MGLGCVGGAATLHVLSEKRERDLETEQEPSSLTARSAVMADAQPPFV